MKRSIARKWAAALESGEYKQTQGTLRQAGRFCCLGVLCNLHAQEHPEIAAEEKKATEYLGCSALPHRLVWEEYAGMRSENPTIDSINQSLAGLNDVEKYDFKQIAKVIRKHWKEL